MAKWLDKVLPKGTVTRCDMKGCDERATWLVGNAPGGAYLCDEHGSPNRRRTTATPTHAKVDGETLAAALNRPEVLASLRLAIGDPGSITPRGRENDRPEPITAWCSRAVAAVLPDALRTAADRDPLAAPTRDDSEETDRG